MIYLIKSDYFWEQY